jgi:hypothetical protein
MDLILQRRHGRHDCVGFHDLQVGGAELPQRMRHLEASIQGRGALQQAHLVQAPNMCPEDIG